MKRLQENQRRAFVPRALAVVTCLRIAGMLALASILVAPSPSWALDKQGSAHGGDIQGASSGFDVSGGLMMGLSLYNPSYAARPDNTGRALMRYAAHADVDLIGRRLSIPIDLNMFSDADRAGFDQLAPTEFDVITGLTTTWGLGPGAVELSSRVEHDRPVDRPGTAQTYVDARARYLFSLAKPLPALARALSEGDVSGWFTLGWFAYNPSYFARPDNTGRALLRYAGHFEVSLWDDLISAGVDLTFFTDRQASNVLRPSELDLTPELIFHKDAYEVHLAFEIDQPIDRDGLVQKFIYLLAVWNFSAFDHAPPTPPLQTRGQILSP